jgi:AraC-like DNA-binding protein
MAPTPTGLRPSSFGGPFSFTAARCRATRPRPNQGRSVGASQGTGPSLAEADAQARFSQPSQFARHFKHVVGVTPGQYQTPAGIAQPAASATKSCRRFPSQGPSGRVGSSVS